MQDTARLMGFVAAHAILCVSRGSSLTVPLLVVEKEDGNTQFIQVQGKSSQDAVAKGERLLITPVEGARRAVLAVEAFLNLPPGQIDAIMLHARCYKPEPQALYVGVPFRTVNKPGGFAVHRPKFITFDDAPEPPGVREAFWHGVSLHPTGHACWSKHRDESR